MAFEITIDSTNEPVAEGETLEVNYTVENTGSSEATQDVNLFVDQKASPGLMDSFESGVSTNWTNNSDYTTSSTTALDGSNAAVRTGTAGLAAGPGTFGPAFDFDTNFLTFGIYADNDAGGFDIHFGASSIGSDDGYKVECDVPGNSISLTDEAGGGTTNEILATDTDIVFFSGRWYEVSLYYGSAGLRAIVYDTSDNSEAGRVEASLSGGGYSDPSYFMLYPYNTDSSADTNRLDYVRATDQDPYTGESYANVSISSTAKTDISFTSSDSITDHFTTGDAGYNMDRAYISTARANTDDASAVMEIPSGSQDGPDIVHDFESTWGYGPNSAHARWWFYFPDTTANATGTDIKGASLSNSNRVDASDGTNYWSCRQEMRDNGDGTFRTQLYIYHADRTDQYGDNTDHWSADYATGQWHQFDQWVDLGTAGENDGVFQLWIDGNLEQDSSGWRLRDSGYDLPIRYLWTHHYQNNTTVSADFPVYYDTIKIWEEKQM